MVKIRPTNSILQLKFFIVFVAVVMSLGGLLGGVFYLYPLKTYDGYQKLRLYLGGVKHVKINGLTGYYYNGCDEVLDKDCQCVALIHGLGDKALSWKKILRGPSDGWKKPFRIYAIDLPGVEGSQVIESPSDFRIRVQAKTVINALNQECSRWTLVGNSLGGWVAIWMALDNPSQVYRLVLTGSTGFKSHFSSALKKFENLTLESLKTFHKMSYFEPRKISDRIYMKVLNRINNSSAKTILSAQEDDDYLDDKLSSLRTKTYLLWGDKDKVSPVRVGELFHQEIRNSTFKVVPRCGHLIHNECPEELFSVIQKFTRSSIM